jgi:hypothetical protein
MSLRFLTGALVLALPAAWAMAGSDPDLLPANLDVRPARASEMHEPGVLLPPRPADQPAPAPAGSSARELCRLGLCLRLGPEAARPGMPMPLLQEALDWSTPTSPAVPRFALVSVSLAPAGAKEPPR